MNIWQRNDLSELYNCQKQIGGLNSQLPLRDTHEKNIGVILFSKRSVIRNCK
jgi:hypothetical protein